MSGAFKGMVIGFLNTLVVAACIAVAIGDDEPEVFVMIVMLGFLPAALTGAVLGHYGERMQTTNRRVLLVAMAAGACGVVAALGGMFDVPQLVLVSCIPTIAACSVLERWTRAKPDEVFPVARVA